MPTVDQIIAQILGISYIRSLLILALSLIIAKLVLFISQKFILKLTEKTKTRIDDLIIERTDKPFSLLLILIGIKLALIPLNLSGAIAKTTDYAIWSLIIIIVTYLVIIVLDVFIDE